jgi:hypothetical protein
VPLFKFSLRQLFVLMTVAAVVFAGVFYFLLFREASLRRERDWACETHLRQIGLALASYESSTGRFPPLYVADARGKPLYSWRVLLLPFVEEQHLYQQWRMDEPWDSPHNRSLPIPSGFSCPVSDHQRQLSRSPYTDYLAVVGPGMAWEEGKRVTAAD